MANSIPVSKVISRYVHNIVEHDFDIIPVLAGNPGISKTQQLHQLVEKKDWGLVAVHLALRPIESLSGLPEIVKDGDDVFTVWSMPEIISQANKLAKEKEKVILFFDDIHLADKNRQAYFFELASERSIAGHKLADNVKIVCAGNISAKAGKKNTLSPIVNRLSYINVSLPTQDWIKWASSRSDENIVEPYEVTNKELLEEIKNINIHPAVIGYISQSEHMLSTSEDTSPFATPRSWYYMSEWLKLFEAIYGDISRWEFDVYNDLTTIANGTIGKAATTDFITYIKYLQGIDIDEIIKNPESLLKINPPEKRMAAYYTAISRLGLKKYKKYFMKFVEFAFDVLGNKGNAPHFVMVIIKMHRNTYLELSRKKEYQELTSRIARAIL